MRSSWRYSIVPVLAGLATLFAALPHRGADAAVTIVARSGGSAFDPGAIRVEPGQRVAFENRTHRTHNATCDGCPWTSGDIQPGQTRFVTFPSVLRSTFACTYHPDDPLLRGTLVVGSPSDSQVPPSPGATPNPVVS